MNDFLIFSIFGAFWRRWYGGGFGWLGDLSRFWKYLFLFASVFWAYWVLKILNWNDWRSYAVAVAFAYHWGLFLRYTSTACLVAVCLPCPYFIFSGVITAGAYAITGKMKRPTDAAEFLAGFLNFSLLYICLIYK